MLNEIGRGGLLKLNHEIAFGFFIVTLAQPLEYQKPRTETLFMDKPLVAKQKFFLASS